MPAQTRLECALLKAVTAALRHGPLGRRRGARRVKRELVDRARRAAELHRARTRLECAPSARRTPQPTMTPRLRVVVDQVASLTDASAVAGTGGYGARWPRATGERVRR